MTKDTNAQMQQMIAAINERHGSEITRAKDRYEGLLAAGASVDELSRAAGELLKLAPMPV